MPMDRSKYPEDWERISGAIRRVRAGTGSLDVETFRALKQEGMQTYNSLLNAGFSEQQSLAQMEGYLRALCQKCHNDWDVEHRRATRAKNRKKRTERAGQASLGLEGEK